MPASSSLAAGKAAPKGKDAPKGKAAARSCSPAPKAANAKAVQPKRSGAVGMRLESGDTLEVDQAFADSLQKKSAAGMNTADVMQILMVDQNKLTYTWKHREREG